MSKVKNNLKKFSQRFFKDSNSSFKKSPRASSESYRDSDSNKFSKEFKVKKFRKDFSKNKGSQKFITDEYSSDYGGDFRKKNKIFDRKKSNSFKKPWADKYSDENPKTNFYKKEKFNDDQGRPRDFFKFKNKKFQKKSPRFNDYNQDDFQPVARSPRFSNSEKWQEFRQQKNNLVFENSSKPQKNNYHHSQENYQDPSKSKAQLQPFHLAMAVNDLAQTREFYGQFLGLSEGRSNEHWIDWNFFGHQFVTHLRQKPVDSRDLQIVNEVDDHGVPVPHFGVVLTWQQWHDFAEKLKQSKIKFVIEPYIRFQGEVGEQATMFFCDPSGNALEFKAFKDISQLFKKYKK